MNRSRAGTGRSGSGLQRAYYAFLADRVEEQERHCASCMAVSVMVSEPDRERLAALTPDARITVVPNGVDVEGISPAEGEGKALVYLGALGASEVAAPDGARGSAAFGR